MFYYPLQRLLCRDVALWHTKVVQVFYLNHNLILKVTQWNEVYTDLSCKEKKKLSCIETLNEKWSWDSGYLTSQTAQSLEALASVKSPTKSSVFDIASFTCLTTVKLREEESGVHGGGEGGGLGRRLELEIREA